MFKRIKLFSIIAGVCIVLGTLTFAVTMFSTDFNFVKMFEPYSFTAKTYENNLNEVNKIEINLRNVELEIVEQSSGFKFEYNEYENQKYIITNQNSTINISLTNKNWYEYIGFNLALNNTAKIYIPTNFSGEIIITAPADNVTFENTALKNQVTLK